MKVVKQDSENIFLQMIKLCWENNLSKKCLYIKFSNLNVNEENWIEILSNQTKSFFNDEHGFIFVMNDNDVFITTQFLTSKILSKFLPIVAQNLALAPFREELVSLYEANVHWAELNEICKKKIEKINIEKKLRDKRIQKEKLEKYRKEIMNIKIDKELISLLSVKRQKRDRVSILVVEDDIFSQRLLKNSIDKEYQFFAAKNGHEAIVKYVNEAPDILFLDIGLPDISGHDILKKIFEIDPDAFVVMLSGNGDKENVLKAIDIGAKGFIGKPFTSKKLFQYIQKSPFIQQKKNRSTDYESTTC